MSEGRTQEIKDLKKKIEGRTIKEIYLFEENDRIAVNAIIFTDGSVLGLWVSPASAWIDFEEE